MLEHMDVLKILKLGGPQEFSDPYVEDISLNNDMGVAHPIIVIS